MTEIGGVRLSREKAVGQAINDDKTVSSLLTSAVGQGQALPLHYTSKHYSFVTTSRMH